MSAYKWAEEMVFSKDSGLIKDELLEVAHELLKLRSVLQVLDCDAMEFVKLADGRPARDLICQALGKQE